MSLRRLRFRKAAGSTAADTALSWSLTFASTEGFDVDKYQWVNSRPNTPSWTATTNATVSTASAHYIGHFGVAPAGDNVPGSNSTNTSGLDPWKQGDRIITDASRTGAAGDRGFRRHMIYNPVQDAVNGLPSGHNQNGGQIKIVWPNGPYRELWFQWWQRFGLGLRIHNGPTNSSGAAGDGTWNFDKTIDFNNDQENAGRIIFGFGQGNISSAFGIDATVYGGVHHDSSFTWKSMNGGSNDGALEWHKFQAHLKADSGAADGLLEIWVDGVQVLSTGGFATSSNGSSFVGWRSVKVGTNQSLIAIDASTAGMFTDYDDLKLSTAGYITQD